MLGFKCSCGERALCAAEKNNVVQLSLFDVCLSTVDVFFLSNYIVYFNNI